MNHAENPAMAKLDSALADVNMVGQWMFDAHLEKAINGPATAGLPFLWPWQTIDEMLALSCDTMKDGKTARRTLAFSNPGLAAGSTHSLLASVQIVLPGELAWAHSHSIAAIRFTIEGSPDLFSVVDGVKLPMETHDLVLTPAWTWHDHHNEGSGPGIWLDVLDLPIVAGLKQMAYQIYGDRAQPIGDPATATKSSLSQAGRNGNVPRPAALHFPWAEVERRLAECTDAVGDPYEGIMLEYTDPMTGGAVLPTLSCNVQMLAPGFTTIEHRRTSSSICYVIEGSGSTVVEGQAFEWKERDVFVLPNWVWHSHANSSSSERALLFVVSDTALLRRMGIDRLEQRRG